MALSPQEINYKYASEADMIREGIPMSERLKKLRSVAYYQMQSLIRNKSIERIKDNLIES